MYGSLVEPVIDGLWVIWMNRFEPYVEFRPYISRVPLRIPSGEEVFVEIGPGTSFGSGHDTTRLCIKAVEEVFRSRRIKSVLDFGCGSGILGISAAVLGAESVLAIDIDPVAVEEAGGNAKRNGMGSRVRVLLASIEDVIEGFDLVIANIVTDELIRMVEGIRSVLEEGGALVVSGISELKKEVAVSAFREAGFNLRREFIEGGWVAIWFDFVLPK